MRPCTLQELSLTLDEEQILHGCALASLTGLRALSVTETLYPTSRRSEVHMHEQMASLYLGCAVIGRGRWTL